MLVRIVPTTFIGLVGVFVRSKRAKRTRVALSPHPPGGQELVFHTIRAIISTGAGERLEEQCGTGLPGNLVWQVSKGRKRNE